jgi:uncharacterized protein (TIGR03435 family)
MKRPVEDVGKTLDRLLSRHDSPSADRMQSAIDRVEVRLRSGARAAAEASEPTGQVRRLNRILLAAASAAVLLAVGIFALLQQPSVRRIDAHAVVRSADRSLSRVSGDKTQVVHLGERIEPGEVFRANDTSASVVLADGSRVELRPQTEFSFESAQDGIRIHLNSGSIVVYAARQVAGRLYVQTKDVTVSVVGTVFFVNTEEEGSRVAVIEGEVRVQQGKTTKSLLPGEQLSTNPMMERLNVIEELDRNRAAARIALLQQPVGAPSPVVAKRLEFAAASIKPYVPRYFTANDFLGFACRGTDAVKGAEYGNGADPHLHVAQGRCRGDAVQLRYLLYYAYGINAYQLRFGPGVSSALGEGFQIEASAEDPASVTLDQLKQMLQAMVEDRFKLKVHREPQEILGYAIVLGKNPPRLQEAPGDEEGPRAYYNEKRQMVVKGRTTLDKLARWLSEVGNGGIGLAPVVNKTALTGVYDYELVRSGQGAGARGAAQPVNMPPVPAGMGPEEYARYVNQVRGVNWMAEDRAAAISSALEDSMGLRLQQEKISVEVLVVDQVEKPTPN